MPTGSDNPSAPSAPRIKDAQRDHEPFETLEWVGDKVSIYSRIIVTTRRYFIRGNDTYRDVAGGWFPSYDTAMDWVLANVIYPL